MLYALLKKVILATCLVAYLKAVESLILHDNGATGEQAALLRPGGSRPFPSGRRRLEVTFGMDNAKVTQPLVKKKGTALRKLRMRYYRCCTIRLAPANRLSVRIQGRCSLPPP